MTSVPAGNTAFAKTPTMKDDDSSSMGLSSSDDELALDGVAVRKPDATSSDDSSFDEHSHSNNPDQNHLLERRNVNKKNSKLEQSKQDRVPKQQKKKKKKKRRKTDNDVLQVEFTFCDMDGIYLDGLKSLLFNSSTAYQQHASDLADSIIENVSVGTVISTTETYADAGTVFGFASVLNVITYENSSGVQFLKDHICLKYCPEDRILELRKAFSGKLKYPTGLLLHGRMLNLPINMVSTLHEQLVEDVNWAMKNAEGGIEEQKSFDFGTIIRIAPLIHDKKHQTSYYKYFDDEIFAGCSFFKFDCPAPRGPSLSSANTNDSSNSDKGSLSIILMTNSGHRKAVEELHKMVN